MPERIDKLSLPRIGVVHEAVTVAVGVDHGYEAAGGVKHLGGPEAIGVDGRDDSARRVENRGRDIAVRVLHANRRPATSNVVVVRLSSGSTPATGRAACRIRWSR